MQQKYCTRGSSEAGAPGNQVLQECPSELQSDAYLHCVLIPQRFRKYLINLALALIALRRRKGIVIAVPIRSVKSINAMDFMA